MDIQGYFTLLGDFPSTIKRDKGYFSLRGAFLDCRGKIIFHETANIGYCVKFITGSHSFIGRNEFQVKMLRSGIEVQEHVYIGSFSILYNTKIGHHSIVVAGTVLTGRNVAPYTMVAGNPAVVIARWKENHWEYDRRYFGKLS